MQRRFERFVEASGTTVEREVPPKSMQRCGDLCSCLEQEVAELLERLEKQLAEVLSGIEVHTAESLLSA